jgi:formiminoglutamate deiminase
MTEFHAETCLLPEGWASGDSMTVDRAGRIAALTTDTQPAADAVRLGTVLPGMANLHSHSFQRAMAGLTERRGESEDSFWSWRQLMYAFNERLTPDHVEAIAALVQVEMLESGFTSVGEFHYLHHGPDGTPYDDRAEMAGRICAAADATGIALTLLPVYYRYSGFGEAEASHGQRRFLHDPDSYAALIEAARRHVNALPHARLGLAPHSLRAASVKDISAILPLVENAPVHIHISEQTQEVEDCLAVTGQRPVAWLMDHIEVNANWCLVHATHMDDAETAALADSGAVAGLCPLTEANLGDGLFPAERYLEAGGRIGIGSDSHIRIDLAEELRLLEYGVRLTRRRRNALAGRGKSTGRTLFDAALAGGAQALQQPARGLAVGERADLVELDTADPVLAGRSGDALLDSWLFCGDNRQVRSVHVGGRERVRDGRAAVRERVAAAYRGAIADLLDGAG